MDKLQNFSKVESEICILQEKVSEFKKNRKSNKVSYPVDIQDAVKEIIASGAITVCALSNRVGISESAINNYLKKYQSKRPLQGSKVSFSKVNVVIDEKLKSSASNHSSYDIEISSGITIKHVSIVDIAALMRELKRMG